MSIRNVLLGAALAAGSMGTAVAADVEASTQFGSEAEFVAKFGAQAHKTGDGSYFLQRGSTSYGVHFGAAAWRASLAEVDAQLENATRRNDGSAKSAADRARLQQRRDELERRLAASGTKAYDHESGLVEQCGFKVEVDSLTVPQIAGGFADATATVTPFGSIPPGGWRAQIDLYATAGASNLAGGLTARYDDYVGHVAFDNTSNPPRPAHAEVLAWYTCLRATSAVEVTAPSGNIWFPNYCGAPITVVAQHADMGCPVYY